MFVFWRMFLLPLSTLAKTHLVINNEIKNDKLNLLCLENINYFLGFSYT